MEQFTGCLRKRIDLRDAPARDLRLCFGLPPDESDVQYYAISELELRLVALDQSFGLDSTARDIWEQRIKALLARKFKIKLSDPDCLAKAALCLAAEHVPGFAFKPVNKKKHGAPREWTDEQLAELFSDVEFLKRTTKLSVKAICARLPRAKGYVKRWGRYGPQGLRKHYLKAKNLSRGLLFQLLLAGLAVIPTNNTDFIDAAIERHALKCRL